MFGPGESPGQTLELLVGLFICPNTNMMCFDVVDVSLKRHSGEEWEEEEQEELGGGGSRGLEEVATRQRGDATG